MAETAPPFPLTSYPRSNPERPIRVTLRAIRTGSGEYSSGTR